VLLTLVGGIGIFLVGMALLTEGLKTAAGSALREVLQRFTGNRFSAVASGAAITASSNRRARQPWRRSAS